MLNSYGWGGGCQQDSRDIPESKLLFPCLDLTLLVLALDFELGYGLGLVNICSHLRSWKKSLFL